MTPYPARTLRLARRGALAIGATMLLGIGAVMFLARGTGEDITGIVAPALLVTVICGVVAIGTTVVARRDHGTNAP